MKSAIRRKIPAGLLAMGAVVVFHFATPLALCGQESGTIEAQAQVVDARAAWTAHQLVEDAVKARTLLRAGFLRGDAPATDAPVLPTVTFEVPAFTEVGGVVLRSEQGPEGTRLTVADLTR
jgi:hypothetical protein